MNKLHTVRCEWKIRVVGVGGSQRIMGVIVEMRTSRVTMETAVRMKNGLKTRAMGASEGSI